MATKKKANTVRKADFAKPEETQKAPIQPEIKAGQVSNLIDQLYFGTAEKTVQESSYHPDSLYKPYNPDDLFQKTNDYSIYEDMLFDDQISVCMQIKKDLVIGSGWDIMCSEDSELHTQIKKDIKSGLEEDPLNPFEDQMQEILSAYEFGFSLSEKIFQHRPDGSLTLKGLKTRHPSTWLIHTDKHGNVIRYEQLGSDTNLTINPRSLIHYINQPRFQNPYGLSDLRSAYNAWFIKRQIIRFYGIFLEKAASPIPVARYDANINKQAVDDIHNSIKKFQTKTALTIPKNIEVEFLEAKSTGDAYVKGINIFNMFIGRSLFIPDLLGFQGSETGGGSYALGKDQIEILFKHIERRRANLERIINKHIVEPMVIYNYGFVENYPKFKLKPISDAHLVELAKLWIEVMKGRVYEPNDEEINHFRRLAKFPEGDVTIPSPAVNNPAGQQGDNYDGKTTEDNPDDNQESQEKEAGEAELEDKKQDDANGSENEKKNNTNASTRVRSPSHGEPGGKIHARVFPIPPGNYAKKVDFKAIESQMDGFKERIKNESLPVVQRIFQDLFDQIERKKIIKDIKPERIETIKLKHLKDLKLILKKNLRDAHVEGKLQGQKELLKGNFRTPLPDDKFLEVLETETFQFIGDWSYKVTQKARIKMMAAIRDGLPLSSVIDELEAEAQEESMVSIERYSRTKITEVMNRGRLNFFNESGVVAAYQYSAILDSVTSEICSGLNGKIFKAGSEPVPPLHFNCRSLLVPITKYEDWEADSKVGKTPIDQFIDENKGEGFSKR